MTSNSTISSIQRLNSPRTEHIPWWGGTTLKKIMQREQEQDRRLQNPINPPNGGKLSRSLEVGINTGQVDVDLEGPTLVWGGDGAGDGSTEMGEAPAPVGSSFVELDAHAGHFPILVAFRQFLLHARHVQHLSARSTEAQPATATPQQRSRACPGRFLLALSGFYPPATATRRTHFRLQGKFFLICVD